MVVGLPVGVLWLWLRVEAFLGGRGDRFVPGDPRWLRAAPTASALYVAALAIAGGAVLAGPRVSPGFAVWANVILVGLYIAVGWFVLRTQLANRPSMGGWSVSGLCLSAIFPTCAVMHGVWAVYAVSGRYAQDGHGLLIDWLSVPAGIYFLTVVRSLYRDPSATGTTAPTKSPRSPHTRRPQAGLLPTPHPGRRPPLTRPPPRARPRTVLSRCSDVLSVDRLTVDTRAFASPQNAGHRRADEDDGRRSSRRRAADVRCCLVGDGCGAKRGDG